MICIISDISNSILIVCVETTEQVFLAVFSCIVFRPQDFDQSLKKKGYFNIKYVDLTRTNKPHLLNPLNLHSVKR